MCKIGSFRTRHAMQTISSTKVALFHLIKEEKNTSETSDSLLRSLKQSRYAFKDHHVEEHSTERENENWTRFHRGSYGDSIQCHRTQSEWRFGGVMSAWPTTSERRIRDIFAPHSMRIKANYEQSEWGISLSRDMVA